MHTLLQDLRFALRVATRQPGFTLAAVLCLALGIGANATMFGMVDVLLLRPPPHVERAEQVVRLRSTLSIPGAGDFPTGQFAYPAYEIFRGAKGAFSEVAAFSRGEVALGRGAEARQVTGGWVTHSFFPLLGVRPALGRFFGADEDRAPRGAAVAVLSHELWKREFAGDPGVLGREIRLGNQRFTVIGVAPERFTGVDLERVDVWAPVTAAPVSGSRAERFDGWSTVWLGIVGRLAQGVTEERAAAQAHAAFRSSLPDAPIAELTHISLAPLLRARGPEASREARVALWLAGVSLIVLLIACANVANLLLTRAVHRRREIAVRLALGVRRGRLVRQLLTESLLLALLGAAAGLLVAAWGGSVIQLLLLPDLPALGSAMDGRVLAFTTLVAVLTGLLCGVAPALRASRPDLTAELRSGTREDGPRRSRLQAALQAGQVALSLVLLVGAGLLVRSLHNVRSLDLGLDAGRVLVVRADLEAAGYSPERTHAVFQRMLERAQALPGVERAGLAAVTPFRSSVSTSITLPGGAESSLIEGEGLDVNSVTPDFFATMGMELLQGRGFTPADGEGSPRVAVVNEAMARWLWPGQPAVGQCFDGNDDVPCREVVGMVRDIPSELGKAPPPAFYLPLAQSSVTSSRALFIRTRGEPGSMVASVGGALQSLDTDLPFLEIRPLQEYIDPQVRPWRLGATLFAAFGLVALALALVGLYGVLSFHVSQRTHEIGVRLALGARPGEVLRIFVGHGLRLSLLGVLVGGAAAWVGARLLDSLLFGVAPSDPATFAGVVLLLLATAAAASYVPARRATRVDPMVALRSE